MFVFKQPLTVKTSQDEKVTPLGKILEKKEINVCVRYKGRWCNGQFWIKGAKLRTLAGRQTYIETAIKTTLQR